VAVLRENSIDWRILAFRKGRARLTPALFLKFPVTGKQQLSASTAADFATSGHCCGCGQGKQGTCQEDDSNTAFFTVAPLSVFENPSRCISCEKLQILLFLALRTDMRLLGNPQGFQFIAGGDEIFTSPAIRFHSLFHSLDRAVLESRLGRFGWHKVRKVVRL
jgi:hypothetical protein